MNRHALAEATSLHDGPVPVNLMITIANSTKVSNRDAKKAADYLLRRLNNNTLNVKLKALEIISFCIQEGSSAFTDAIRKKKHKILAYLQFVGPPNPVYGDEKYQCIRAACQKALVCLNDEFLARGKPEHQQQPSQSTTNRQEDGLLSCRNVNEAFAQKQPERQPSSVGGSLEQPLASSLPAFHRKSLSGDSFEENEQPLSGRCNHHPTDCRALSGLCNGTSGNGDGDSHDNYRQSYKKAGDLGSYKLCAKGGCGPHEASGLISKSSSSRTAPASKSSDAGAWDLFEDCVDDGMESREDVEHRAAVMDLGDKPQQQQPTIRPRRPSYGAFIGDEYTLKKDLHGIHEQMQRILALCETQGEKPLRLEAKIHDLQEQLQQAITEKNYWMKRCKDLMSNHALTTEVATTNLQCAKSRPRKRTNSELILIANTWPQPTCDGLFSEGTSSFVECSDAGSNVSTNDVAAQRSIFRLLQCSDEQCEVFVPTNRSICTQHRSRNNVQLMWDEPPKTVLVVKKPNEAETTDMLVRLTAWLYKEKHIDVFLEPSVYKELALPNTQTWGSKLQNRVECQNKIDFVISLGGDGTVLWVSSLFSKSVPPVFSLAMGSLGFLTPFDAQNALEHLTSVINGGFYMSLRSRLSCTMYRGMKERAIDGNLHALNEIVIDRGPSSALVELNCYCDGLEVTKIAADGIIIATPTGSTAYSLSAGGSMAHPSVPSMLFTPICPHTLSFRPLIFHDSATLKIELPSTSRASACYVSFDGKDRVRLELGDSIVVRVSSYPLPSICRVNENQDWFDSMITNLNWNQRRAQKPWQPAKCSQVSVHSC